ncbi:MAG: NADH-quinone oxidoreductase subunit J [Candidatus Limnocylindrus sp.]
MPLPPTIPFIGITWADALFLLLGGVVLGSATLVVLGRDIIRNGLMLILTLGALAGIYVVLGASIVAGAQVLVYIGAISVLILFAIMLTQSKSASAQLNFQTQALPAALASALIGSLLAVALGATQWGSTVDNDTPDPAGTATAAAVLFGPWLLAFEVASVLILAAVIGGIYLAMKPADSEEIEA